YWYNPLKQYWTMLRRVTSTVKWRSIGYGVVSIAVLVGLVARMGFIEVNSSEQAGSQLRIIALGTESFVESEDVTAMITENYGQLEGRTLTSIPIHQIETELKQIPFVLESAVTIDMDGILTVRIRQREAVVRVINKAGLDFYVDRQ